jgi:hypothetical protein
VGKPEADFQAHLVQQLTTSLKIPSAAHPIFGRDGATLSLLTFIDKSASPLQFSTRKPDVACVPPGHQHASIYNLVLPVSIKRATAGGALSSTAVAELVMLLWHILHEQKHRHHST